MIIMIIIRSEVALPSPEVEAPQVLPLLYHVLPFKRWLLGIRLTEYKIQNSVVIPTFFS